jgi:hypothetical protein
MTRLSIFLLLAVLVSALALVHSQYETRRLFMALESAKKEANRLEVDHDRLEVERRAHVNLPDINLENSRGLVSRVLNSNFPLCRRRQKCCTSFMALVHLESVSTGMAGAAKLKNRQTLTKIHASTTSSLLFCHKLVSQLHPPNPAEDTASFRNATDARELTHPTRGPENSIHIAVALEVLAKAHNCRCLVNRNVGHLQCCGAGLAGELGLARELCLDGALSEPLADLLGLILLRGNTHPNVNSSAGLEL